MAEKSDIFKEIEALSVHCRPPMMEVSARVGWLNDWAADLAEFPIEAVRVACRKWRHSGAQKFPTPGQLLPLVREQVPEARGPRIEAWKPKTEDEYRALSLREKIREREILAREARRKAGPMFRNTSGGGKPSGVWLEPSELSETWRHWTQVADGHEAEARRLREHLRRPVAAE